jgi:hypothetical protein
MIHPSVEWRAMAGVRAAPVRDFTLDIDANPDAVRGQALLLGYLDKPYTTNTGWLRLLYKW